MLDGVGRPAIRALNPLSAPAVRCCFRQISTCSGCLQDQLSYTRSDAPCAVTAPHIIFSRRRQQPSRLDLAAQQPSVV